MAYLMMVLGLSSVNAFVDTSACLERVRTFTGVTAGEARRFAEWVDWIKFDKEMGLDGSLRCDVEVEIRDTGLDVGFFYTGGAKDRTLSLPAGRIVSCGEETRRIEGGGLEATLLTVKFKRENNGQKASRETVTFVKFGNGKFSMAGLGEGVPFTYNDHVDHLCMDFSIVQ